MQENYRFSKLPNAVGPSKGWPINLAQSSKCLKALRVTYFTLPGTDKKNTDLKTETKNCSAVERT